jgi:hypothetical protein
MNRFVNPHKNVKKYQNRQENSENLYPDSSEPETDSETGHANINNYNYQGLRKQVDEYPQLLVILIALIL